MRARLRIRGGLALARDKPGLDHPPVTIPPPATLVLPLLGHGGRELAPTVGLDDRLAAGDPIAAGLVAPAAGRVVAIESHPVLHAERPSAPCLFLERDANAITAPSVQAHDDPRRCLRIAGVHGLGGAGYPSARKLDAIEGHGACRLLLVNACECEPGIACDEALLQRDAATVVAGIERLAAALRAERVAIAIEADKRTALARLRVALEDHAARRHDRAPTIELLVFEPVYPSGAEAPLLAAVLAHLSMPAPPSGVRPAAHGLLCLNVATAHALAGALAGSVPTSRLVTFADDGDATSLTAEVSFGTPLIEVLRAVGWRLPTRVRIGGPLSGFVSRALAAPVTATVHAVAALPARDRRQASDAFDSSDGVRPCIRCGDCESVCPVGLQPQQLHWLARADVASSLTPLRDAGLDRCIECGCCDVVCPSRLPLTETFRRARRALALADAAARDAAVADALIARRRERLARQAAQASIGAADDAPTGDIVGAALARARRRARDRS